MIPDIDPAWQQAIAQQNERYQQQMRQALDLATLHQAMVSPTQYGYGGMQNPLFGPASNSATELFRAANPNNANLSLMQSLMSQSEPGQGGTTISSDPRVLQALLAQSGMR